jgi:hypothetical protein
MPVAIVSVINMATARMWETIRKDTPNSSRIALKPTSGCAVNSTRAPMPKFYSQRESWLTLKITPFNGAL